MPIKKTGSTVKKSATKSPVKAKVAKVADHKEHIVTKKLESVMDTKSEATVDVTKSTKAAHFPWWGLISLILVLVFGTILLYQNNTDFRNNLGKLLNSTGLVKMATDDGGTKVAQAAPFTLKLTIVYDQASADMKTKIETYVGNIEKNLANTKVAPVWYDKNSAEGQAIIKQVGAKFIPIFTTDATVLKHPQYSLFASALALKNGVYQFQSEGIQYLTVPDVADARVIGAAPDKAKVKIIEYASMTCEFCAQMHPILENVMKKYGKDVSWILKNYDRGGVDAVFEQGVECAADQNKLDKMVGDIYARQTAIFAALQGSKTPEEEVYNQIKISAKAAGANADKVVACVKAGTYTDKIAKQTAEGLEFGIMGTPGFFVNKQFVSGAMDEVAFTKLVEGELNK